MEKEKGEKNESIERSSMDRARTQPVSGFVSLSCVFFKRSGTKLRAVVASAPHEGSRNPQESGCGSICNGDGGSKSFEGSPAGRVIDASVGRVAPNAGFEGPSEGPYEGSSLPSSPVGSWWLYPCGYAVWGR